VAAWYFTFLVGHFRPGGAKMTYKGVKNVVVSIDAAHFQPASAGVVTEHGGFSPARLTGDACTACV
jgi:hypothetical protein